MYIKSFRVQNYRSFLDSGVLSFSPGFNVIVGQNNVGKTALLQAMSLKQGSVPHRSLASIPSPEIPPPANSTFTVEFGLSQDDFLNILMYRVQQFSLPLSRPDFGQQSLQLFLSLLPSEVIPRASFVNGATTGLRIAEVDAAFGVFEKLGIYKHNTIERRFEDTTSRTNPPPGGGYLGTEFANVLTSRIYSFRAERFKIGESSTGLRKDLEPDASNLAEVLHNLVSIEARFKAYCAAVRDILPQIRTMTIPLASQMSARILLWSEDPELGREDLATSLSDSGTGISQVLAILYVVLNSSLPQTIIIDEPQSFLHPGAIRKLFEIIRQHPEHQYIITSHSPTAIAAAAPQSLLIVKKEGSISTVEGLDPTQTEHMRLYLRDIGARLSDVFEADNILWVEGPTEERCFPLIVRDLLKRPLMGTLIRGVVAVGDLERKDADRVWEIYERLSSTTALLPPALGFIFDREERNDGKRADLERASKKRVSFLARRMYESYLIDPEAIAAVMRGIPDFSEEPVTTGDIAAWIAENRWDRRFVSRNIPEEERSDESWYQLGDAASATAEQVFAYVVHCRA